MLGIVCFMLLCSVCSMDYSLYSLISSIFSHEEREIGLQGKLSGSGMLLCALEATVGI